MSRYRRRRRSQGTSSLAGCGCLLMLLLIGVGLGSVAITGGIKSLPSAATQATKPAEEVRADEAVKEVLVEDTPSEPTGNQPPPAVSTSAGGKTVHVKGHFRKDGTWVRPHTRSAPHR